MCCTISVQRLHVVSVLCREFIPGLPNPTIFRREPCQSVVQSTQCKLTFITECLMTLFASDLRPEDKS